MDASTSYGFGKFLPGFDFLQQLRQAGSTAGVPPLAHWMAPTVSVEELDKRIQELQSVLFWLDHNRRALQASVQALEVQKMTLSTLQGMNVDMAAAVQAMAQQASASPFANWPLSGAAAAAPPSSASAPVPPAAVPDPAPSEPPAAASSSAASDDGASASDPLQAASTAMAQQWWAALSQQFQHIAQQALPGTEAPPGLAQAAQMGTDFLRTAAHTAQEVLRHAAPAKASTAATAPARQPAAKKAPSADKKPPRTANRTGATAAKKTGGGRSTAR